ncbi:MAG: HpcH/HpaI aldolase/citrate lyase family protein [Pirellulales bacterium]
MHTSKIKAKLAQNKPALISALHLTDPSVYEMASLLGIDGIWMDLEHHGYSVETAGQLMRAARVGGADIMARPAKGEFMRLGRLFEAGATGVLYPRCDNAAEAAEVVKWSKFAPLGRRGFDGGNPDMPYCTMSIPDYIAAANRETFVAIQIEDPDALDCVEAIAAVEGVDVLFFGPSDFSIISGIPGQFDHPTLQAAMKRIAAAAKKAGIHWGMPVASVTHAQELLELGARFICHGCDIVMVKAGLEAIQRQFAPLGFSFEKG